MLVICPSLLHAASFPFLHPQMSFIAPHSPPDHPPLTSLWSLQLLLLQLICPHLNLRRCLRLQPPASHPVPTPFIPLYQGCFPVTYCLQVLPGVSDRKAAPLPDALVDHQLAEQSRGAPGGQFGRRGVALPSSHTWDFGRLQLQVHVLLERSDAGVHLDAQLVGRHPRSLRFFASSVRTQSHQTAGATNFALMRNSQFTHISGLRRRCTSCPSCSPFSRGLQLIQPALVLSTTPFPSEGLAPRRGHMQLLPGDKSSSQRSFSHLSSWIVQLSFSRPCDPLSDDATSTLCLSLVKWADAGGAV